ncbi:MAG: hypothetical protein PHY48_01820 [Candidatus Cloacimonetes bacterium]|nr:hypothetical protein [Candidatus Cloacimonadota bacterium]
MSNRLIMKNSMLLYFRLLVTAVAGILVSRFVLKALGVSEYGLYNVVAGVVSMMAFVNTIMVSTTYRYIAYETGKPDGSINRIFNTSLVIHIGLAFIVVLLAFTAGLFYINNYLRVPAGRLPAAVFVFSFSIISTVFSIISIPFNGLLVAKEKFSVTVPIEISTKLINLGLVVLLGYLPYDKLMTYAVIVTLVHLLNPVAYILYCYHKYKEDVKWKLPRDKKLYGEMAGFSGWIGMGAAASVGQQQGTALIINRFFGTIMNASFGLANQMDSIVRMFAQGLNQAVIPQITKSYSSGDIKRSSRLVMLSSKYSFFFMLIPSLPILLEIDFIMSVWLTVVPPLSGILVRIMLLRELIGSASAGLPALIQASGKQKWFQISGSFIILTSLPAAYFAFKQGAPPQTIQIFFLIAAILALAVRLVLLRLVLQYDVKLFIREYLSRMLLISILLLPLFLLRSVMADGVVRFFLLATLAEAWLLVLVFAVGMEKAERQKVLGFVNQARLRLMKSRFSKDV